MLSIKYHAFACAPDQAILISPVLFSFVSSRAHGPLIAKNFCGSILADCFVLTPHNNQLRHCQRNTHSSRLRTDLLRFPLLPPLCWDVTLAFWLRTSSSESDVYWFCQLLLFLVVGVQRRHLPKSCKKSRQKIWDGWKYKKTMTPSGWIENKILSPQQFCIDDCSARFTSQSVEMPAAKAIFDTRRQRGFPLRAELVQTPPKLIIDRQWLMIL